MAMLKIQIKDSKLISNNDVNVETFSGNYAKGNGWKVFMNENGKLSCYATHNYKGVRNQLKFEIDKGVAKLTLTVGERAPRVLKNYTIPGWPVDGVIGLPGGPVDKRRPYFRDADLQKFLDEHGITIVHFEQASGFYEVTRANKEDTEVIITDIQTDGFAKIFDETIKTEEIGGIPHSLTRQVVEVFYASWVIKTVYEPGRVKCRILYTLDNPMQIVGLPKPE